jgi:hypothetical protein
MNSFNQQIHSINEFIETSTKLTLSNNVGITAIRRYGTITNIGILGSSNNAADCGHHTFGGRVCNLTSENAICNSITCGG